MKYEFCLIKGANVIFKKEVSREQLEEIIKTFNFDERENYELFVNTPKGSHYYVRENDEFQMMRKILGM